MIAQSVYCPSFYERHKGIFFSCLIHYFSRRSRCRTHLLRPETCWTRHENTLVLYPICWRHGPFALRPESLLEHQSLFLTRNVDPC